jgi:hypothetical protein
MAAPAAEQLTGGDPTETSERGSFAWLKTRGALRN